MSGGRAREPEVAAPADDEHLPGVGTDLAWSRSGLALTTVVAVVLRRTFEVIGEVTAPVAVYGLIVAGSVAWALALVHARLVARDTLVGRRVADPAALRLVAFGTIALAAGALVLALAPAPG